MSVIAYMRCWRGQHKYKDENLRMRVVREMPDMTLFEIENTCIYCGKIRQSRAWIPNATSCKKRRRAWD